MGKVDVGCGEPVVHGSTDDLGRKEERAEPLAQGRGDTQWLRLGSPLWDEPLDDAIKQLCQPAQPAPSAPRCVETPLTIRPPSRCSGAYADA